MIKLFENFINESKLSSPPGERLYPIPPKIGDWVKCINAGIYQPQLNDGERYKITNIEPGLFRLTNSQGKNIDNWDYRSFELDTEKAKKIRKEWDELVKDLDLKSGVVIQFRNYWPSGKCDISVGEIFSHRINNIHELFIKSVETEWNNYIGFKFLKNSFIKRWDNWDEYYKEKRIFSKEDPYGEEDWEDTNEEWRFPRFWKKKGIRKIEDTIEEMKKLREKLDDNLKTIKKSIEELEKKQFDSLSDEEKKEILKLQLELKNKLNEIDPYGEDEWEEIKFKGDYEENLNKMKKVYSALKNYKYSVIDPEIDTMIEFHRLRLQHERDWM